MNRWGWLGDIAPYLPATFGAMMGLRWTANQTPRQRLFSFLSGFGAGVYFGDALAEIFTLGPKTAIAVGILCAMLSMDIFGGLMVAASQFRLDPSGTLRSWLNIWLGRQQ